MVVVAAPTWTSRPTAHGPPCPPPATPGPPPWPPAAWAERGREPRPARHPAPTSSPRSAATGWATRCSPRRRAPASTSSTYDAVHGRPAPTRPSSTPTASSSSRSPTWPPPTTLAPEQVDAARDLVATAELVVLDGNLGTTTLGFALDLANAAGTRVVLEPVSVPKAAALVPLVTPERPLHAVTPNRDELGRSPACRPAPPVRSRAPPPRSTTAASSWCGCGWAPPARCSARPADHRARRRTRLGGGGVVDVTGAGDAMLAAFCHALLGGARPWGGGGVPGTPPPRSPSPALHRPDPTSPTDSSGACCHDRAPPAAHPHRGGRRRATRRRTGGRAGEHDHQPRDALPQNVAMATEVEASSATTAQYPRRSRFSTAARASAWVPTTSSCSPATATSRR